MPLGSVVQSARDRLLTDLSDELASREAAGLKRHLTTLDAVDGPLVRLDGRELICWCSNDYLGLSTHPRLAAAATHAASRWGIGARASRLLAGTTPWHEQLEYALAEWFGAEDAVVYPSGYLANLGTLSALLSARDAVFVDRLAHASLIDAARHSRAALRVFHHKDPAHLAQLLSRAGAARRRLIVTEGLFSMDGDQAPLGHLAQIAEVHDAIIYVDDAHGAFVLGGHGRGTPEALGVSQERFLYMGTLGKALGCQGGFVIGPKTLADFLRNRSRTFVYSTALAVPTAAAAAEALRVLQDEPDRRQRLQVLVARLHRQLEPLLPISSASHPSHIVPVIVGDSPRALECSRRLFDRGHWAPAIRPPTVPKGTARLRLSVTALHTEAHIDSLARTVQDALAATP